MFDHFDFLAPIYDHFIKAKPPETLTSLADLSPSVRLLDAGGGTGRISQYFKPLVNQVIIADLSIQMLAYIIPFTNSNSLRLSNNSTLSQTCISLYKE